jgi:integrase
MSRRQRIYWRERGGVRRAYGDFRDFADVGGRREPLAAPGEKLATTDPDLAAQLLGERLKKLEAKRAGKEPLTDVRALVRLGAYAEEHLVQKARTGKFAERWLSCAELYLKRACDQFGGSRPLTHITVQDVQQWIHVLQGLPTKRVGGRLTGGSVRHHLNALSNLYRRAISEGLLQFNPVAALMDKPAGDPEEARWLEVHEGAILLESARLLDPSFAYPLLGTFLLTGGRKSEVLGLEVADVSFDRKTVTFRRNSSRRRLKTRPSQRVLPLWPQLEEILKPYADRRVVERGGRLLFPRFTAGQEAMITDFRKTLDRISIAAGWEAGEITSKMFRHSYCSARLQTLDRGAPVSTYTVSREMGHGSQDMVEQVYSHLGQVRHRSEVVEYRIEQHIEQLADRLSALRRKHGLGTTVPESEALR